MAVASEGQARDAHEPTLGAVLEASRIQHRVRRTEHAVAALRKRAAFYDHRSGGVPRPLQEALADFARRLHEDKRRLRRIGS